MTTFKHWLPEKYAQDMETYWPWIFIMTSIYFMLRQMGIKKILYYIMPDVIVAAFSLIIFATPVLSMMGLTEQFLQLSQCSLSGNIIAFLHVVNKHTKGTQIH